MSSKDRGQFRQTDVDTVLSKVIGEIIIWKIQEIMEDKAAGESIEVIIYRSGSYNRGRNRSRERSFSRNYDSNSQGVQAIVGQGQI